MVGELPDVMHVGDKEHGAQPREDQGGGQQQGQFEEKALEGIKRDSGCRHGNRLGYSVGRRVADGGVFGHWWL